MSREPQSAELASTTEASSATAQSRGESFPQRRSATPKRRRHSGAYEIGPGIARATLVVPYERNAGDPIYRPLKIYTSDPSASMLEGAVALVNVPYEPLEKGPSGRLFEIWDHNESLGETYSHVDLDEPGNLIRNGRAPSPSDWQFHQQMVYAVCTQVYAAFRAALGRSVSWGFGPRADDARLRIRPHAFNGRNACYVKEAGELQFGYYRAEKKVAGRNLPGSFVFTCLSHDVIAHEVTHALVDGLRAEFAHPCNADVPALHEALADLVAIFQHFSYETVVLAALRQSRGDLLRAGLLTGLARQFNYTTTGNDGPLRTAIDVSTESDKPIPYRPDAPPHELGSVLVSAIFEAFVTIFTRKTESYMRLATQGTGVLPLGELPLDLQALLAAKASKLASQFLTICIRAIDYCPPVAITFGEFLRAMITADYDIVPDDRWGYREALIDAFRRREIYPDDVANLSEDALLWRPPESHIPRIPELGFARLRFRGDPGRAAGVNELHRQASALGEVMVGSSSVRAFGVTQNEDPALMKDTVARPIVQSIRSSRRIGPDGQVVFDLIAEVTQRRVVQRNGVEFEFYGGSTVIIDPHGTIRYVISKRVTNEQRLESEQQFMVGPGKGFWNICDGVYSPKRQFFRFLHEY